MQQIKISLRNFETISLNEAYNKIIDWFFAYPNMQITLSELANELLISKKTANQIVTALIKEGFLNVEEVGRAWRISCNLQHHFNRDLKIGRNLVNISRSGIIPEIYRLVGNPKAIVLFGSYRKGDDNEKSDIDLAVEVLDNKDLRIVPLGKFNKFGFRKNVPVNLHIFCRKKIDLNLFANIANGIVLDGFLEAKP